MQQRGNPHAHIVVCLEDVNAIVPEKFQNYVTAEFPDPKTHPKLHKIITIHNYHKPCDGVNGDYDKCHVNGKECKAHFPKKMSTEPGFDRFRFPTYIRRRKNIISSRKKYQGREIELENEWVVGYNPYLSMRYDSHINVEIVSTNRAVKYLYKYLFKGNTKTWLSECDKKNINEIRLHKEGIIIGPYDAIYTLFSQKGFMQKFYNSYKVIDLAFHLP